MAVSDENRRRRRLDLAPGCDASRGAPTCAPAPTVERRSILRLGAAAAAASAIGPLGCGAEDPDRSAALGQSGIDEAGTCQASCSSDANVIELSFAQYPHLAQVGASVIVNVQGYADPACKRDAIIVAHASSGTYVAFSASCTHMCCSVQFRGHDFFCPCHGSTYDLTGRVTGGPASRALANVSVCSDSCGVYLTVA